MDVPRRYRLYTLLKSASTASNAVFLTFFVENGIMLIVLIIHGNLIYPISRAYSQKGSGYASLQL